MSFNKDVLLHKLQDERSKIKDVLSNQRGNIIRMIREAANENGERFLETVDTQTYGSSV